MHELPRKVKVFIADTSYARYTFKTFVKPVFDAAALDYETVIGTKIAPHITELIAAGKREAESKMVAKPTSIMSRVFGTGSQASGAYDPIESYLKRKLYNADEDWVVVGNEAWKSCLTTLDESLRRTVENPVIDEHMAEEQPSEVSSIDIVLPKLAFVPGRNMVYI